MPSTLATPIDDPRSNDRAARSSSPTPTRRLAAFAIDLVIIAVLTVLAIFLPPVAGTEEQRISFYTFLPYVPAAYLLFRDAIGGRSLGKLATGLLVWDDRAGRPAGFLDSVIRNAPFAVLLIPVGGPPLLWPLYVIKLVAAMLSVTMLWQILRGHPRRILEGPATTHVIDARR